MSIARYYDSSKNSGGFLVGVPLRDLTQEEYDELPPYLQQSVDASPLYRRTKPQAAKPAAAPKPDAPADEVK